jgi:hypothetical protein
MKVPDAPVTIREAVEQAAASAGDSDPRAREKRKVVLAVQDFMMKNAMKAPNSLNLLVPTYFDSVPLDPQTKQPFQMVIVNGRPEIIAPGEQASVSSSTGAVTVGAQSPTSEGDSVGGVSQEYSDALVASLLGDGNDLIDQSYVYDPTGKRDPFVPFDFSPDAQNRGEGIFCCDVRQFRVSTILMDESAPRAIVETQDGKGFIVREGSEIGFTRAKVIEILPDQLRILDTSTDFTGKTASETIVLTLRTN